MLLALSWRPCPSLAEAAQASQPFHQVAFQASCGQGVYCCHHPQTMPTTLPSAPRSMFKALGCLGSPGMV